MLLTVAGMAVQNSLQRAAPQLGPMTTVMTGNLVRWLTPLNQARRIKEDDSVKRRALERLLVTSTAGCFAGAIATTTLGLGALVMPACIVLVTRLALA